MAATVRPRAIALMGPTASGKTNLALSLCKALPCDIVSVDSAMVYRGMDIGTAKPTDEELHRAPHRLIDIRDVSEPYSAADFCRDAEREIADIVTNHRIPLLVGGTMLYFKALLEGLSDLPQADPGIRSEIEKQAQVHGWAHIHRRLSDVDPLSASRIHPNHSQRLSRALEVFLITGRPLSDFHAGESVGLNDRYDWLQLALVPRQRSVLHERINARFDTMLALGLVQEVEALLRRDDVNRELPSMRAVGYRQVCEFLAGECDYQQMQDKGRSATRQLAKRQLTWLKSWANLRVLYMEERDGHLIPTEKLMETVLKILSKTVI